MVCKVVANCVTALAEIQDLSPETEALVVTSATLKKLLMALNECTEFVPVVCLKIRDGAYKCIDGDASQFLQLWPNTNLRTSKNRSTFAKG